VARAGALVDHAPDDDLPKWPGRERQAPAAAPPNGAEHSKAERHASGGALRLSGTSTLVWYDPGVSESTPRPHDVTLSATAPRAPDGGIA
jgi:hypothetical protein